MYTVKMLTLTLNITKFRQWGQCMCKYFLIQPFFKQTINKYIGALNPLNLFQTCPKSRDTHWCIQHSSLSSKKWNVLKQFHRFFQYKATNPTYFHSANPGKKQHSRKKMNMLNNNHTYFHFLSSNYSKFVSVPSFLLTDVSPSSFL